MAEKVTLMKLEVDLQCDKCNKKVREVLSKFLEIRDQVYDEKQNTVIIKVVHSCPEKIRGQICCKGKGAIKNIEIIDPKKLKDKPDKTDKKKDSKKNKEPEKDKAKPVKMEPKKSKDKPAEDKAKGKREESKPTPKVLVPVQTPMPVPVYGGPLQWHGRPVYGSHGGGRTTSAIVMNNIVINNIVINNIGPGLAMQTDPRLGHAVSKPVQVKLLELPGEKKKEPEKLKGKSDKKKVSEEKKKSEKKV